MSLRSLRLGAPGRYAHRRLERSGKIPAYLVLLRVGFTLPRTLLPARCALTAPFHPYPKPRTDLPKQINNLGRYILCCTSRPAALKRPSRTLSGTLPCGVRTFLPRPFERQRSSGRLQTPVYPTQPNKTQSNCVEDNRLSLALQPTRW
jgi:hypothetical protein